MVCIKCLQAITLLTGSFAARGAAGFSAKPCDPTIVEQAWELVSTDGSATPGDAKLANVKMVRRRACVL